MLQLLPDNWTLDISPAFSRRETDDGFTVFERLGMEIWVVVYSEQPFDPDEAVQLFLNWEDPTKSDFPFRTPSDTIAGRAFLTKEEDYWTLTAVAASYGRLVQLDFRFQEQGQVDSAIAIWHSLQHSVPAWVEMCGHAKPPLAQLRDAIEQGTNIHEALEGIQERGQASEAAAVLLEALKSESPTVRQSACDAIGLIGDRADEVMSALRTQLGDEVVEVRARAADALLDLGEPPEAVVPSMIEGLQKHEKPMLKGEDRIHVGVPDRYHAARILRSVGEAARPARDVLLKHQMDESGDVRLRVAEALLNVGEPKSDVLPPLLDGLHSPDLSERERMRFVKPLLNHGVSRDEMLPLLIRTLTKTSDNCARGQALKLLGSFGAAARSAADAIERAIIQESDEWGIKVPAAQALMRIGTKHEVARPIVFAQLARLRGHHGKAELIDDLARAASLKEDEIACISQELDADESVVRYAAAFALAKNGTELDRALPILIEALNDPNDRTRWDAIVALGKIGSTAERAVNRLVRLVREEKRREVRLAGIWAIGQIGTHSDEVKPLLLKMSESADEEEQQIIDDAVRRLGS